MKTTSLLQWPASLAHFTGPLHWPAELVRSLDWEILIVLKPGPRAATAFGECLLIPNPGTAAITGDLAAFPR